MKPAFALGNVIPDSVHSLFDANFTFLQSNRIYYEMGQSKDSNRHVIYTVKKRLCLQFLLEHVIDKSERSSEVVQQMMRHKMWVG